jgi:hypothetical protein
MLRKLNLIGADDYAVSIVTYYVAEMLVKFGLGQQHPISIGSEQGDIGAWDDMIIQEVDFLKHVQIKRQNTNFSDENCLKSTITKNDGSVNVRKLSAIDATLKSLADWSKGTNLETLTPKRKFEIVLPTSTINIKRELSVNVLKNLCENHIKDVTTAFGLETLQANDTTIDRCYKWLNTWCDFENWEHILKSLKILKISANNGSSEDVDLKTKQILSQLYNNTDDVFIKLKSYVTDNTTFTGAITPRPLFHLLKGNLLPEIKFWTQFERDDLIWKVSGTHDTDTIENIERASVIVPSLWNNQLESSLKIIIPDDTDSLLLNKVLHLALHMEGLSNSHILNHEIWSKSLKDKLVFTLGIDKNDCANLSIKENSSSFHSADSKVLDNLNQHDNFAKEIDDEIINTTWHLVCKKIVAQITSKNPSDLRNAIEERWKVWSLALQNDKGQKKLLFSTMLHPKSEGEQIEGELRIGIKTTNLITEGILLLLVVSVALSAEHKNWQNISTYSSTTIGLAFWSGSSDKKRKVQDIEDGVDEIIGKTSTDILILSKVKLSESEVMGSNIASGNSKENNLAQPHRPKLIVTNHKGFRDLISTGDLNKIKEYLENIIQRNEESQNKSIQNLT